jgi:hypothetical protein
MPTAKVMKLAGRRGGVFRIKFARVDGDPTIGEVRGHTVVLNLRIPAVAQAHRTEDNLTILMHAAALIADVARAEDPDESFSQAMGRILAKAYPRLRTRGLVRTIPT